jgi:hypothetical protein
LSFALSKLSWFLFFNLKILALKLQAHRSLINILDPPPVQLLLLQSSSLLGEGGSSQNGKFETLVTMIPITKFATPFFT